MGNACRRHLVYMLNLGPPGDCDGVFAGIKARTIEGCAAIDLDGGLSALGYQLSARIRWGHSLRRVQ
jgi:hypothetical protein